MGFELGVLFRWVDHEGVLALVEMALEHCQCSRTEETVSVYTGDARCVANIPCLKAASNAGWLFSTGAVGAAGGS